MNKKPSKFIPAAEARDLLIKKGLIKPRDESTIEVVKCSYCPKEFERLKRHKGDTHCGGRHKNSIESSGEK